MPLVDYIIFEENDDIIGIWRNEESLEELLNDFPKTSAYTNYLEQLDLEKRKKEFCITQLLLKELTGKFETICKESSGKPYLKQSDWNLSISHSDDYSTIFLSKQLECGIDVECIQPRIAKIAHKFVSEYEALYVSNTQRITYITVIWCVKEALYKWYAKKGLDFKENMIIHPFSVTQSGAPVYVEFVKDGKRRVLIAHYKQIDNNIIAWVAGEAFQH